MNTYKIVILPGDGIGPEVAAEAKRILETISDRFKINLEIIERPCGFEYQRRTGQAWPEGTFELCRDSANAILLGAIGRADCTQPLQVGEMSPGGIIVLGLRSQLDLFANVRPVYLFKNVRHTISNKISEVWSPSNVNMVIVRENTEGLYYRYRESLLKKVLNQITEEEFNFENSNIEFLNSGHEALEFPSDSVTSQIFDLRIITESGAKRIINFAFELANHRKKGAPKDNKKRVTCVDKSNVLSGCRLFRKVFNSISKNYPEIDPDYAYVDAFTLSILQNPEHYNIVVTTNLFGDIITDLAAMLQGGLGMAPSANLGSHHGMFEPVHGTAPDIAGKHIANPIGMILSTQMMLEWLGDKNKDKTLHKCSNKLLTAVKNYFETIDKKSLPHDLGGQASTSQITSKIIENLESKS